MSGFKLYIYDNVSYETQYKEAMAEWKRVKKNGADVDVWTDGQYLNLIRSKIKELSKLYKLESKTENFPGWDIPEKVPFELMVKKRKVGMR